MSRLRWNKQAGEKTAVSYFFKYPTNATTPKSPDRFFYYLNMGNDMSSHASSVSDASSLKGSNEQQPFGVRGRTNTTNRESSSPLMMIQPTESCDFTEAVDMMDSSDDFSYDMRSDSDDEYDSDDDDDDEDEEFILERMRILEETRKLGQLARAFLHPEDPVEVAPWATGRCYFDRPSAPERTSVADEEARADVLADAVALGALARHFAHPEISMVTTSMTVSRCYFDRPSAPVPQESPEEADVRFQILADAVALKQAAHDYLHPEIGVLTQDPCAMGRNFFNRPSAPEQESVEEAEERAQILADALAFKKLAIDYAHPELGVTSSDPTSFGRNYFNRASAPEQEDFEYAEERAQILADALAFKKLAIDYAHPELGVTSSDPTSFGRNYFSRPSAPEQEDFEYAEERAQILADALAFKKLAIDYAHPELGVTSSDPTSFGRNYFSRPSAPEQEDPEEAEERAQILADALAFKKLAIDYAHPELGITSSDPTLFGRNYFSRPSAPEQEDFEYAEERHRILAEIAALKTLAIAYFHPEVGITDTFDAALFGRNFFSRPSAPEQEDVEYVEQRSQILAEALALEKLAVDYLHPELPVKSSDPTVFGHNYFTPVKDDIHSSGEAMVEHYHHEVHDTDYGEFLMEEDEMFQDIREQFQAIVYHGEDDVPKGDSDEKEGNLSRSPSSVMLFGL